MAKMVTVMFCGSHQWHTLPRIRPIAVVVIVGIMFYHEWLPEEMRTTVVTMSG